ncbi:MAG TPA: 3'-5' exonuclease, partial [Acidobacteriaceae bacterium]|nr:3'-5' exonuclease [Acidobacteriaceae bacterium]
ELVPPATPDEPNRRQQQSRSEAEEVLHIARTWITRPLPPNRTKPWTLAVLVRSRNHLDEIVSALRRQPESSSAQPRIPFRAVEIEFLHERQEILDLTALTRALLHPADRVAALAILRAPWCGLSLADLHTLTGADDPALRHQSIPRLLADRGHLLPPDACDRLTRIWTVLQSAVRHRARLTTAQLVERAWLTLGGDTWLTSTQLTNTRRFFQLLDQLEDQLEAEAQIIDPTLLETRLRTLYAEPDPIPPHTPFLELLTIHKAKGLEWDVVLIPALERATANNRARLLTWSELSSSDSPSTAAHIMLAPIPGRGEPSKALNAWLNSIHKSRETAETKRLFYVACTRARQELHLFASPTLTAAGTPALPADSLLKAAWPAAALHFAAASTASPTATPITTQTWAQSLASESPTESEPLALAAAAEAILQFPAATEATSSRSATPILQRLPTDFDPTARFTPTKPCPSDPELAEGEEPPHSLRSTITPDAASSPTHLYVSRPEGSYAARSFGNTIHALLDVLATRIAHGDTPATLLAELPVWLPRISSLLRADGLPRPTIDRLTREALTALTQTLNDPDGQWLLASHAGSSNEFSLTAEASVSEIDRDFSPRMNHQQSTRPLASATSPYNEFAQTPSLPGIQPTSIRIDRIFEAGPTPHAPGQTHLWIIDYKTSAFGPTPLADFLAAQRATYAPQLETYARILAPTRNKSPHQVHLALYFPTIPHLLWWPLTSTQ